jgi:hypothetical protein
MLGLYAFFYIALHFLFYLFVDQAFDWRQLLADVAERPYITLGFTALLLLVPLAATSTRRAMRRLGRRWQKLHRLVYVAVILGWRLQRHWRRRAAQAAGSGPARPARGQGGERDAGQDQHAPGAGAPVQLLAQQPPAEA